MEIGSEFVPLVEGRMLCSPAPPLIAHGTWYISVHVSLLSSFYSSVFFFL